MTRAKTKNNSKQLQVDAVRVTRTTFFLVVLTLLATIIFDSGNLITRDAVVQRWILACSLLLVNVIVWYFVQITKSTTAILSSVVTLVVAQILFASFMIYWERGMAATSTLLLAVPIVTSGVLKRRRLLLATTTLTAAAYSLASVKYFNDFFNEGYRIQLWGNLFFYSGLCFIIGWTVMVLSGLRHDSR